MTRISLLPAAGFALAVIAAMPVTRVNAANADAPYTKVDKTNDAGNDTGNSKVEGLNRGQLEQNPKPGAGPMTGSKSDTSPASSAAPPTNEPSAPTGH